MTEIRSALAEHGVDDLPDVLSSVPDVDDLDHLDARQPEECRGGVPNPLRAACRAVAVGLG